MSAVATDIPARRRRGRPHGPEGVTLRQAAEAAGIPYHTLYYRVARQGMTLEQALARGLNPARNRHPAALKATAPAAHPWGLTPEQAAVQAALRRWPRAECAP
jgi:hypothetical protein